MILGLPEYLGTIFLQGYVFLCLICLYAKLPDTGFGTPRALGSRHGVRRSVHKPNASFLYSAGAQVLLYL